MTRKESIADKRARLTPAQRAQLSARLEAALPPTATPVTALVPDAAHRHEPFPLTQMQQAYWVGRESVELGNVACHIYFEVESDGLDLLRLTRAFRRLIARHDALRLIILPSGQQRILTEAEVPPYEIAVCDLRGQPAARVEQELLVRRERMSHQVLPAERWPLFELHAALLDGERTRLAVSLDTLIGDAWSFRMLLGELGRLYVEPAAPLPALSLSFRDYVLAERASQAEPAYAAALSYWQGRLAALPPAPELPLLRHPANLRAPRFVRRNGGLLPDAWQRFRGAARQAGLTGTAALLAAYAEVLGRFSASQRFTINVPLFNRLPLHPEVPELVGEFASFMLVEVDRRPGGSFSARARRLQEQYARDLDHSRVSGVQVLRELGRIRVGQQPAQQLVQMPVVFTSILSLDGLAAKGALAATPGELGELVYSITQTPQVWLDVQVIEVEGGLHVQWDAVEELFPAGLMDEMSAALWRLLEHLARDPAAWTVEPCDLGTAALPLDESGAPPGLLHEYVQAQIVARAAQPAVIAEACTLSYGELGALSARLSSRLSALGVPRSGGGLVAVVMEKGWEQAVAALGVLAAGAAYVPIDAAVPAERLRALLSQSGARCVLTQPQLLRSLAWPEDGQLTVLAVEAQLRDDGSAAAPAPASADDLAYVLFTSGSTGTPKGALLTHRGAVNAVLATNARFGVGPGDRVLALTALHHDMSVFDLFGLLAAGGQLVMPAAAATRDPAHWAALLQRHEVTIWNSVPAYMEMLLAYADAHPELQLPALRLVFLGGDWIAVDLPARLRRLAPSAQLVSVGGPTETTLWNIWYPVTAVDPEWRSIPYGRPIPNTRYYVLSEGLEDCPTWVPGELCCAGPGVARGYLGDPELWAKRCIPHPRTGERLYRTGDRGRFLPDGNIELLGRLDSQLKLLGQRIEPAEVEAALRAHPAVTATAVVGHGPPRALRQLVAYVVTREPLAEAELSAFLAARLPAHMVPSALLPLPALPLTANGKVDRRALAERPLPADGAAVAPETSAAASAGGDVLLRLTALAEEVLERRPLSPDANLMSLGVDSIDLVRLANRVEKSFGHRPGVQQMFQQPTLRALSGTLAAGRAAAPAEAAPADYELIDEPAAREAFRRRQLGVRTDLAERPRLALPGPPVDEALRRRYDARRSHRRYALRPVPAAAFGALLAGLRQLSLEGAPKYLYPSGGGLYPLQLYVHAKPGRVAGVEPGAYYYHPVEHCLQATQLGALIDRSVHVPFVNQPVFDEAAFSLFFVVEMDAIGPLYGGDSLHIATLEAGIVGQLLDERAFPLGLGLCHIGRLDFAPLGGMFALRKSQQLVHAMVGGLAEEPAAAVAPPGSEIEARVARLRERVKQLSPAEVQALLKAQRGEDGGADE